MDNQIIPNWLVTLKIYEGDKDRMIEAMKHLEYEPTVYRCERCKRKWYEGFEALMFNRDFLRSDQQAICHKCEPEILKENEERRIKSEEEENKRREEILFTKIPPRYLSTISKPKYKALKDCYCSIIFGNYGVGKTWEAYAMAKDMLMNGDIYDFEIITELGLLIDLKSDFDKIKYKTERTYGQVDLLIIDEFGKTNDTDFNKAHVFEILNYRYDWLKKTIIICNAKDEQDLRSVIPSAVLDRFRENIIYMDGQSKRYS